MNPAPNTRVEPWFPLRDVQETGGVRAAPKAGVPQPVLIAWTRDKHRFCENRTRC